MERGKSETPAAGRLLLDRRAALLAGLAALAAPILFLVFLAPYCAVKHFCQHPGEGLLILAAQALAVFAAIQAVLSYRRPPRPTRLVQFGAGLLFAAPAVVLAAVLAANFPDYAGYFAYYHEQIAVLTYFTCLLAISSLGLTCFRHPSPFYAFWLFLAVIGVSLVAAVLPSLLRSRITAGNEASPISSMRTIATSEMQYKTYEASNRFGTLAQMSAAIPPYVDTVLGSGTKSGYYFDLRVSPDGQTFTCRAWPPRLCFDPPPCRHDFGAFSRAFWTDQSGIIRWAWPHETVDSSSTPID